VKVDAKACSKMLQSLSSSDTVQTAGDDNVVDGRAGGFPRASARPLVPATLSDFASAEFTKL
jgi:hypothetical protein